MALCGPLFLTSKSIIIAILSPTRRLFDHVCEMLLNGTHRHKLLRNTARFLPYLQNRVTDFDGTLWAAVPHLSINYHRYLVPNLTFVRSCFAKMRPRRHQLLRNTARLLLYLQNHVT